MTRLGRLSFRAGTPADAPVLARAVADGFEGYRAWAAPGWRPPDEASPRGVRELRDRLATPGVWSRLALDGGRVVGHVLFEPARTTPDWADLVPGVAHVAHVFVDEGWWGTGLAARLLAAAVVEARAQGYRAARLWTPEGQARARAFYAREGWQESGVTRFEPGLGLDIVELTIALRDSESAEDAETRLSGG
jgi:GNAT superfamily N-acetyltransferase